MGCLDMQKQILLHKHTHEHRMTKYRTYYKHLDSHGEFKSIIIFKVELYTEQMHKSYLLLTGMFASLLYRKILDPDLQTNICI